MISSQSAVTIAAGVPQFLFRSHFRVHGESMRPSLLSGDLLHVLPASWERGSFSRGAIVVAKSPAMDGACWVKRIIGLPGEFIAVGTDGVVTIDQTPLNEPYCVRSQSESRNSPPWLCDGNEYFLMGDNRDDSNDSRRYGPVARQTIIGRVWFHWPRRRGFSDLDPAP